MLHSCLILGDSIAVGLSWVIKGCTVVAKVGMSSAWILAHAYSGNFDTVYISSGSNDPYNPALESNLIQTRQRYKNSRIIWIAPVNQNAHKKIYLAAQPNDVIVSFTPGPDHVHPRSYQELAAKTKI